MMKKMLVVWNGLVVDSYRDFFYHFASRSQWKISLVAPHKFKELGFQEIASEGQSHSHPLVSLKNLWTLCLHPQIVIYFLLRKQLKKFLTPSAKESDFIFFFMVECYSITALYIFLCTKFLAKNDAKLVFFCAQNLIKELPKPIMWIRDLIYRKTTAVAYIGEDQKKYLLETGYRGRLIEFPLWFNARQFRQHHQEDCLQSFQNSFPNSKIDIHNRFVVAFVGTLNEQKGILDLMQALEQNTLQTSKLHLIVAGDGVLKEEVFNKSKSLIRAGCSIDLLGFVDASSMPIIYNLTDLLVVPSRSMPGIVEQFSRVIVEAGACGCRTIGSDSGHIHRLLLAPQDCFEEGDVAAIASRISEYQEHGSDWSRQAIADHYHNLYSDQVLAANFYEQLQQLHHST